MYVSQRNACVRECQVTHTLLQNFNRIGLLKIAVPGLCVFGLWRLLQTNQVYSIGLKRNWMFIEKLPSQSMNNVVFQGIRTVMKATWQSLQNGVGSQVSFVSPQGAVTAAIASSRNRRS